MAVRIGFIGAGEIAHIHARALSSLEWDVDIAAAFDVSSQNAQLFAEETGAALYDSAEALLDSGVDAVYILTRHDSHFEYVTKALAAGKAVFCEKPLSLRLNEAEEMRRLAGEKGLPFAAGFNHRCAPGVEEMRRQLANRRPRALHISMVTAPFLHTWAGLPEVGGGILHCLGSHAFDLARYLMQEEPMEIAAFTSRLRLPETHLDDTAVVICRFPEGRLASLHFHDHGSHAYSVDPGGALMRVELFADGGLIAGRTLDSFVYQMGGELLEYRVPERDQVVSWGYLNLNRRFIAYLRGESQLEEPPLVEDGYQAARLVDAALRSVQTGQVIKL